MSHGTCHISFFFFFFFRTKWWSLSVEGLLSMGPSFFICKLIWSIVVLLNTEKKTISGYYVTIQLGLQLKKLKDNKQWLIWHKKILALKLIYFTLFVLFFRLVKVSITLCTICYCDMGCFRSFHLIEFVHCLPPCCLVMCNKYLIWLYDRIYDMGMFYNL